ncbi:MAG: NUDIX hydrolase [Bacillota bacterium]
MLFRSCAGGVVFYGDRVYLLKNEKGEWVLPKGAIQAGLLSQEVAKARVKEEAGIAAEILSGAGETCYEFYSMSRKMPVCNEITWYVMRAVDGEHGYNRSLGFTDGGYFPMEDAVKRATYSQDKALIRQACAKYKGLV